MNRQTKIALLCCCVVLGAAAAIAAWRPEARAPFPQPTATLAADRQGAQVAGLSAKVDELERALAALKQQQGARSQAPPTSQSPEQPAPRQEEDRPTREQADARFKEYMAGVARSFESEKLNAAWAKQTSSQIAAAFAADGVLREAATDIECREHTCRVQIDDTDHQVSPRMRSIAAQLGKTLPSIRANRIDQGNGRSVMVLYMTANRFPPPSLGAK